MKSILSALFLLIYLMLFISCGTKKEQKEVISSEKTSVVEKDSLLDTIGIYPQKHIVVNPDNSVSEYPADTIRFLKPKKSRILNPTVSLEKLFNAWVGDLDDPHATFYLTREHLYVVAYEGNADMPYILKGDSLTVYYEEGPERSKIKKLTNDSLVLAMDGYDVAYVRWRK